MIDPNAKIEWDETIRSYFSPGERGAMLAQTYISPRLDLWNMESVILHAYDAEDAKATFKDNEDIYPMDIRTPEKDFNWRTGIIHRVKLDIGESGFMPSGGPQWSEKMRSTFETWVTNYWPIIEPLEPIV